MRRIDTTAFRIARRGTSREINRQIALNLVREKQPISRADLARLMGVRPGAISLLVDELLHSGRVFEGAKGESSGGRDPELFDIITMVRDEAQIGEVQKAIDETIAHFQSTLPDPQRLADIKHQRRYAFLMGLDTPDRVGESLQRIIALTGGIEAVETSM